jgi:ubiquinone biosynthesis protein
MAQNPPPRPEIDDDALEASIRAVRQQERLPAEPPPVARQPGPPAAPPPRPVEPPPVERRTGEASPPERQPTPPLTNRPPVEEEARRLEALSDPLAGFEVMPETPAPGLTRRFFTTWRHAVGLLCGAAVAVARDREQFEFVRGFRLTLAQIAAFFLRPFVDRKLRGLPLEVQLRRRLEILGPTYIKLGQVLALREDILPRFVTDELKNLLDRLPVVPFERYLKLVEHGLGRPVGEMFSYIDPKPLGSASIAQIHAAVTLGGDEVILKVVKPNIRETLKRDARLLDFFGAFLQIFFARYQPRRILDEFAIYTLREVDLRREADNAEQFAINFADHPGIVFPKIYRQYSSRSVLTMERFFGRRPDSEWAQNLAEADRERLVDIGAEAIIRMLYRDGFFHADLHPGNLFVLEGRDGRVCCGFIDLGMVGRFDEDLRRTLTYYYYSLVTGDAENAARYLTSIAETGEKSDAEGFRKAVADLCRRFHRGASFRDFSLAQMIMESVSLGAHYRVYFPVETVLMTKALITFEGVGNVLMPGFDVAKVSERHVNRIFRDKFSPFTLGRESMRGLPELVDLVVRGPVILSDALRFFEHRIRQPAPNPLAGLTTAILAGSCLVGGALLVGLGAPWYSYTVLFTLAVVLGLRVAGK